jgi:hypothetical protein
MDLSNLFKSDYIATPSIVFSCSNAKKKIFRDRLNSIYHRASKVRDFFHDYLYFRESFNYSNFSRDQVKYQYQSNSNATFNEAYKKLQYGADDINKSTNVFIRTQRLIERLKSLLLYRYLTSPDGMLSYIQDVNTSRTEFTEIKSSIPELGASLKWDFVVKDIKQLEKDKLLSTDNLLKTITKELSERFSLIKEKTKAPLTQKDIKHVRVLIKAILREIKEILKDTSTFSTLKPLHEELLKFSKEPKNKKTNSQSFQITAINSLVKAITSNHNKDLKHPPLQKKFLELSDCLNNLQSFLI